MGHQRVDQHHARVLGGVLVVGQVDARDHGFAQAGETLYGAWSQRWGRHAAELLLTAEPEVDAVFCGSDQIAAGFVETARERGRATPGVHAMPCRLAVRDSTAPSGGS
ncbi:hypothetical protein ACFFMN_22535 [Planobispora siamensis]|uniref:hypothetical protein n=1 Tax=Planobispora siamensis TaxID=936338 RepID=UPI001EF263A7|nr:hypothetical protein [Planobispora siamensis]